MVRSSISPNSVYFVAESDALVVGWCDVTPSNQNGLRPFGTLGMALLPAFRDQGLGRKLLQATIQAAHAEGLCRVELQLLASNQRALALYERIGFVRKGRKRVTRSPREGPQDVLSMALPLPAES